MDIISHPLITYYIFEIGSRYKKHSLCLDTLYERDESIKCDVHTEHGQKPFIKTSNTLQGDSFEYKCLLNFTCHTMKFHNRLHTDVQANLGFTSELESKYNHLQFLEKNFKSYKNLLLIQFTKSVGTCGMLFSSYYEKKKVSGFRFLLL